MIDVRAIIRRVFCSDLNDCRIVVIANILTLECCIVTSEKNRAFIPSHKNDDTIVRSFKPYIYLQLVIIDIFIVKFGLFWKRDGLQDGRAYCLLFKAERVDHAVSLK